METAVTRSPAAHLATGGQEPQKQSQLEDDSFLDSLSAQRYVVSKYKTCEVISHFLFQQIDMTINIQSDVCVQTLYSGVYTQSVSHKPIIEERILLH